MNPTDVGTSAKASELREAFDRSFAEARRTAGERKEDFLAIALGAGAYALRLSEIGGLFADKKITRVPSGVATLIGIAGFRGAILPVYDLALLVGYATGTTHRWLVTAAEEPVAFAFDGFERHLHLSHDAVAAPDGRTDRSHVREVARAPDRNRPIVDLASVLDAIRQHLPPSTLRKER